MQVVRVVLVGSGSSSSTPSLHCALSSTPCATCRDALRNPHSRNHRLNPCLLIQLRHPREVHDCDNDTRHDGNGGRCRRHEQCDCTGSSCDHGGGMLHNVLIDCGKTLREAALKVFPRFAVHDLSAVLLTHEHADACFGLDDLRELVRPDTPNGLDVYADAQTTAAMQRRFDYLLQRSARDGRVIDRRQYHKNNTTWTATLDWHVMQPLTVTTVPMRARPRRRRGNKDDDDDEQQQDDATVLPWRFVAIPVLHGPAYYSNAFLFRLDDDGCSDHDTRATSSPRLLLYVSDMSEANDAFFDHVARAKALLCAASHTHNTTATTSEGSSSSSSSDDMAHDVQLEVLLLDMLSHHSYVSHLSVDASLALARTLNARRTYFVGMSHSLEHDELTAYLQQQGVAERMHVGFDGCVVAEAATTTQSCT